MKTRHARRIIAALGSQNALARALGQNQQTVNKWFVNRQVPPEWCRPIEFATDRAVTRYDLRPDVFGKGPWD